MATIASEPLRGTRRDRRWSPVLRLAVAALGAIWVSVLLISIFSPDNVSGTQQEHIPLAAILTWIWGLVASRSLVLTLVAHRDEPESDGLRVLVGGVIVVWAAAVIMAIWGPVLVTGTDPTRLPVSALIAPIVAMILTTTACQLLSSLGTRHEDGDSTKQTQPS